ncbi:signal peptide peptidase SppA [Candidatus Woesearchaeota archaeon]|nr:signal peptide peptidase SppA [Candidatus Woesearchaeota archaeon]
MVVPQGVPPYRAPAYRTAPPAYPPQGGRSWPQAPAPKKRSSGLLVPVLVTIVVLVLLSLVITAALSRAYLPGVSAAGVALIPVEGTITSESSAGLFSAGGASSDDLVAAIESADEDGGIAAIMLSINSPGGSAVASEEVARAVREASKPTVALIRDSGASGAYWIASASDWIVASPMSLTGSVGVVASQLEFAGLLQRYNVTYRKLTAGELKDIGTPYREMTAEEQQLLQEKLDRIHAYFLREVGANRKLDEEQLEELRSGIFFLGEEALERGLVDELGGKQEVEAHLKSTLGVERIRFVEFRRQRGLFEGLGSVLLPFRAPDLQAYELK